MTQLFTYNLEFLKGTLEYVTQELLAKYPNVEITKQGNTSVEFSSEINSIETFRNLYSPTHISDSQGNTLNLSKRDWRQEYVSAGINPSLAYIMCMIAKLSENDILFDPFCGSSVIPITAIKYFSIKRVICSDISGRAIQVSKQNFLSAGIEKERYLLFRSDIQENRISKQNVDKIVSNLPFGIRVGEHSDNKILYTSLEKLARKVLRKRGVLVLLTQEKKLLREVFKKDFWNVKSFLRVDSGGLLPEVFVISRR